MAEFSNVEGSRPLPQKVQTLIPAKELPLFQKAAERQTRQKIRVSVKAREGEEYYSMGRTEDYPAKPKKVPKGELCVEITSPTVLSSFWVDVQRLRRESVNPKK